MAKLKRLLSPRFWKLPKKLATWAVAPRPGPHKKFESIPLQVIVRDILKIAETGKEAKSIIKKGEILVDGKIRKDHAYPVGLMDVVAIPKIKKYFRCVADEKGLKLIEIEEEEKDKKICRIINKTSTKKGKIQLNLHDGRNFLLEKDVYKTGDSLLLKLPEQKILEHIKIEKGNVGLIIKGKNSGKVVKIKEVITRKGKEPSKVVCNLDNEEVQILKSHIFVVGKEKPVIKLS